MTPAEQHVADLEAEVAELRRALAWADALDAAKYYVGYADGRASILGVQAGRSARPRRRHLTVVRGGGQ